MKSLWLLEDSRDVDLVTESGNLFVLLFYSKISSPRYTVWEETNLLFDFVGELGFVLPKSSEVCDENLSWGEVKVSRGSTC